MHIIFKNANKIAKMENFFFQAHLFMYSMMSLTPTNHSLCQKCEGKKICAKNQFILTNESVYVDQRLPIVCIYLKLSDLIEEQNWILAHYLISYFCWRKEWFIGINDIFKYINRSAWKNKFLNPCNFISIFSTQTQLNSFCKKNTKSCF